MATRSPTSAGRLLGVGLDDLAAALRGARSSVAIATPFMSHPVAALLVRAADEGRAQDRRLLTALNVAAVEGGYLDPDGIEEFHTAGFEIRSLRNLHAKVVLTDRRWGLVGSGNLTVRGSNGGNAELGVVLSPRQAATAQRSFFEKWWKAADPIDLKYLRSLRRRRRPRSPECRQRQGRGGFFDAGVRRELESFARDPSRGGYWLKIMYGTPERARTTHWRHPTWVSDRHTIRASDGEPLGRPSYRVGDHLVIYLSREGRRACPAIVRVTERPVFDLARVRREGALGDDERWGWLTEVDGVAATPLARAPTLADIGVRSQSVRQHGHIKLSHTQYRRAMRAIRGW